MSAVAKIKHKASLHRGKASGVPFIAECATGVPLVSITIAFREGATIDPTGMEGRLRLALRLMRRGTGTMGQRAVDEAIDELGGELSVDVSQTTSAFHGQVIRRNLEPFFALIVALLCSPSLSEEEFGRLLRETQAELVDQKDSDRALCNEAFRRTLFGNHPFSRPVVGTTTSLQAIRHADLAGVSRSLVRQGNVLLGFSGDIDEATATRLTAALGERIAPPQADGAIVLDEPTQTPGRHLIFVDKPDRTQTQVLIGRLGTLAQDDDHIALSVANAAFGGTFTARLMKEVRSKRGWSYGAYSRLGVDRARQAFSMWTFPAANQAADCIALELSLLEDWVAKGLSERELAFVKNYLVRSYAFEIDTPQKRLGQALDEDLLGLPARYYEDYCAHVTAVTIEQANAAVQRRIDDKDLVIAVVGSAATTLSAVEAAVGAVTTKAIIPFDQL